jgi:hypothetical protein
VLHSSGVVLIIAFAALLLVVRQERIGAIVVVDALAFLLCTDMYVGVLEWSCAIFSQSYGL